MLLSCAHATLTSRPGSSDGWHRYDSDTVTSTDEAAASADDAQDDEEKEGWNGVTPFPLIQGTDCCGRVVQLGAAVDIALLGRRSLVRCCNRSVEGGFDSWDSAWMASNYDGAFAQVTGSTCSC